MQHQKVTNKERLGTNIQLKIAPFIEPLGKRILKI